MTGPKPSRPALVALVVALGLLLPGLASAQLDDTALFSTQVPPNVVLLVDNSGSMHHIVWHKAFVPGWTPGPTDPPLCTDFTNGSQYFYTSDTTETHCGNTRTIYVDPDVSPSRSTRYWGYYLNWLFSDNADPYVAELGSTNNGTYSTCIGGGTYSLYRRSRVTAAKDVLREVICQVNAAGEVRFGIAKFRRGGDPEGGYVRVPVNDYLDGSGSPNVYTLDGVTQSHGDHLDDAIEELKGEAWTPLSETLFQIYSYFMSRTAADRPLGADASTRFPEYEFRTVWNVSNGGPHNTSGAPTVPDSPVQWSCQKNFVVIITDGEPTKDDFDLAAPDDVGFADFDDLIGDYLAGDETETGVTCTGCNETTLYLDDIAKFMQENDFRPDLDDDQLIDVYTVGFTTSAFADDILQRTADQGNGKFLKSNNAEELAEAIVAAVTDIVRKSQAFTAPTVPATVAASGNKFYTSYFVPSRADGFWEGHLRSWDISRDLEIFDKFGACALDDPDPGECDSGLFKPSAVPFWDAHDEIPATGSRDLYTSTLTGPGISARIDFDMAAIDAALLGVVPAEVPTYPYPGAPAADEEELADMIVQNVRGCEFGTGFGALPCVDRPHRLGDTFHSKPVVVTRPDPFGPDPSYRAFARNLAVATRDRVILVGANDGFFRSIHAGEWDAVTKKYDDGTGAEIAGFMPYAVRQTAKQLPLDSGSRDVYGVDGSPTVVDAWFYTNPQSNSRMADGSEWHTVAVSGLRQGGESYFALDVTDPDSPSYPAYLWEFPREDAPPAIADYIGETWSKPIVTRIRVSVNGNTNGGAGFERWVAIFGGGYHAASDPNDQAAYDPTATEGRAIVILDLKTGEVIGMKKFDPAATDGQQDMLYAIPASPAVFDLDFDGFSDLIYVGDLGGNVWKWVIEDLLEDPVNGTGNEEQPHTPFKKFFTAPVYDSGTALYYKSFYNTPVGALKSQKLWIAFGSGERSNLPFMGFASTTLENNRLYSIRDVDPFEKAGTPYPTLTEADLTDLTSNTACASIGNAGFYLRAEDGEKFVSESEVDEHFVFTVSYKPIVTVDPCKTNSEISLYAVRIYCGESLFEDGTGNPIVKIDLETDTISDPVLTVGDSAAVMTGCAEGVCKQDPPDPDDDSDGGAYWRELRFGE